MLRVEDARFNHGILALDIHVTQLRGRFLIPEIHLDKTEHRLIVEGQLIDLVRELLFPGPVTLALVSQHQGLVTRAPQSLTTDQLRVNVLWIQVQHQRINQIGPVPLLGNIRLVGDGSQVNRNNRERHVGRHRN